MLHFREPLSIGLLPEQCWKIGRQAAAGCLLALVIGNLGAAPPTIFQTLDPVRPNETLLLFGAGVAPAATAEGMRLADAPVNRPPKHAIEIPSGKPKEIEMLQATDLSAKVLIPSSWKAGIYAARVRNADGIGAWQFINRPKLWWQMSGIGGLANPAGQVRIFGKNFGPKSRVWLTEKDTSRELPVKVARDYDVAVMLPEDVAPGHYQLWLHNGFGGSAGFCEPLDLEVAPIEKWPAEVYDVTKFGAKGDNRTDDTSAIRRALAAALEHGGGVVYLPRGSYLVTGKLVIPPKTTLRGEGRDAVWIKVPLYWPQAPTLLPEFDAVIAGNGSFAVEDLSIIAQPVLRLIAAPDDPGLYNRGMARPPQDLRDANDVRLYRLRLWHLYFANRIELREPSRQSMEGPSTIVAKGTDFSLTDSEIVSAGMPIQISGVRARVCRNVMRIGRGNCGIWNFREGVFEENDVSAGDLLGTQCAIQGVATHLLFARNYWHGGFGGEREALTFDTPYVALWMGTARVNGVEVALNQKEGGQGNHSSMAPEDVLAVVAGGRGLGQVRRIRKISSEVIEIERPFEIIPDERSLIALVINKSRVIVTDNRIEDASVAVQLYSQSFEFLISRNRCSRTGGSYSHGHDSGDSSQTRRFSYSLFNQWLDNDFDDGLVYEQGPWRDAYVGYTAYRTPVFKTTVPAIGNRFERNRLSSGTTMGATNVPPVDPKQFASETIPFARDAIFEKNSISYESTGITIDPGHEYTFLRANEFKKVGRTVRDQGLHTRLTP